MVCFQAPAFYTEEVPFGHAQKNPDGIRNLE